MTDTDLTGVWRTRSGSVVRVTGAVPGQLDRWAVTHPDDDEPSIHTGTFIHASWSRVPDAEPAEAEDEQLPDWCDGDLSHLPPAVPAEDEQPEPFEDWARRQIEKLAWLVYHPEEVLAQRENAEPAPSPLPWIEHPDAWWRRTVDAVTVTHSSIMAPPDMVRDSAAREFERVAVIPWDLIEDLWLGYGMGSDDIDAVIDAADGAS